MDQVERELLNDYKALAKECVELRKKLMTVCCLVEDKGGVLFIPPTTKGDFGYDVLKKVKEGNFNE